MSWARPSNLWPLVRLAAWLVLWAVAVNVALRGLSATPLLNWLPDRQTGVGFTLDNQKRIKGAEEQYLTGAVSSDKRLGAIVGISNIREAVSLDIMNQQLGREWRFIGIAGAGAGAASIADNSKLLEDSSLRPDLVIVGLTPAQVLDTLLPGAQRAPSLAGRQRLVQEVKEALWIKSRRRDVSVSTERALLDARAHLFQTFDVHLPTADTSTPWRSMLRVMGSERFPDKAFRDGLAWARSVGAFDIQSYERSQKAPQIFADTLKRLSAKGSRVVVVLTPEYSMLRSQEPGGIATYLQQRLRTATGIPDIAVLDYRSAIADDGFVDTVHVNTSGSKRFTPLLVADVRRLALSGPPVTQRAARQ